MSDVSAIVAFQSAALRAQAQIVASTAILKIAITAKPAAELLEAAMETVQASIEAMTPPEGSIDVRA